jgi:epoxide hydrolase-like predicted phosphatase
MAISAIIWDLGGVIVRTEDTGPRLQLANRLGLSIEALYNLVFNSPSAIQATLGRISAEQHWNVLGQSLNLPPDEMSEVQRGFWGGDRVDEDLVDYIRSLRPKYRIALLSNAWSNLRQDLDQRWKIAEDFDEIFISSELGVAKPDPRIFQVALQYLNCKPDEVVFIDDFLNNVGTAKATGIHTIQFVNLDQARADLKKLLNDEEVNEDD